MKFYMYVFHLDAKYYFLKDLYTDYILKTVLHTHK